MRDNQSISGRQDDIKQHRTFIIGFALIVLIIFWFLLKPFVSDWKNRQKNQADQRANAEILKAPSIVSDNLFQMIQKKSTMFLVDISAPDDFKRGHIATAVNIYADKLNKEFVASLGAQPTADIFVINQGNEGDLAGLAASVNKIVSAGFANAKYLRGGISDWKDKGYPLVSSGGSDDDNYKVKKISIDEIKNEAAINPGLLQFLDVRVKDEYLSEHIVEAINIPLSDLETRKSEIPSVKKTIVYGSDENESFQASVTLFDLNFFNIYQMDDGIAEWKGAGGNTKSGN
ncbi:MAG TPA: rhodanese-like domain-containing protein [Candidatus Bathyarchaeia archaeon]|nr:rhodanese-like domain-containing protein [Candidatus Bathyarchaeia archaeon]